MCSLSLKEPPLSADADHEVVFIDVNSRAFVP